MELVINEWLSIGFGGLSTIVDIPDGRHLNDDDKGRPCVGMIEKKNDHHRRLRGPIQVVGVGGQLYLNRYSSVRA